MYDDETYVYNVNVPFEFNEFRGMKLSKGEFHGPNTEIMVSGDLYGFFEMEGIFRDERNPFSFLTL